METLDKEMNGVPGEMKLGQGVWQKGKSLSPIRKGLQRGWETSVISKLVKFNSAPTLTRQVGSWTAGQNSSCSACLWTGFLRVECVLPAVSHPPPFYWDIIRWKPSQAFSCAREIPLGCPLEWKRPESPPTGGLLVRFPATHKVIGCGWKDSRTLLL